MIAALVLVGLLAQDARPIPQIVNPKPMDLSVVLPKVKLPLVKLPTRDSKKHRAVRAGLLVVSAALDIHSTRVAMGMPELRESNSWLYGERAPLWRLLVVKGALSGVMMLGANEAAYRHPVDGLMPVAIFSAHQGYAAVMNYRLIAKIKRGRK